MDKWFDLFKTGTHTDTKGNKHEITPVILQAIEKRFSELSDDSALCIGHPDTSSPAYGWLDKVKIFGEKLRGMAKDVVPEFADMVNKRMFKKISISLRPDLSIRHVGFLGAMPPAVKGLVPVPVGCFAEDPGDFTIEFSEADLNFSDSWFAQGRIRTIGNIFQRLRDYLIEKSGVETADKVIEPFDLDFLKADPPPDLLPAEVKSFNESITPERGKEDTLEIIKKNEPPGAVTPAVDFAEKVTTLEGENSTLRTKVKDLEREKIEGTASTFMEKLGGKLLPKFKQGMTELLVDLQEAGSEINFSETEKKPAHVLLQEFMESVPVQVPTKEVGAPQGGTEENEGDFAEVKNVNEERLGLHNKAKALSRKEKIPYETAVRRVMKGGN